MAGLADARRRGRGFAVETVCCYDRLLLIRRICISWSGPADWEGSKVSDERGLIKNS